MSLLLSRNGITCHSFLLKNGILEHSFCQRMVYYVTPLPKNGTLCHSFAKEWYIMSLLWSDITGSIIQCVVTM